VPERWKNRYVYRCSFLIYATHQSIISVSINRIWQVLYAVFHSVFAANLFGRILCILLIIAVNMGIHAVMSRFTPRTLRVLTGGRC
jgi:ABC-type methionine transport system permease subunit